MFLLPNPIATLAPSTACGDALPVTNPLVDLLKSPPLSLGSGNKLDLLPLLPPIIPAIELAGLAAASGLCSSGLEEGIMLALRSLFNPAMVAELASLGLCAYGPGVEANRSRNESLECDLGVVIKSSSGRGDALEALPSGLRNVGSFELDEEGVRAEVDRTGVGVFLAYGLGVVNVKGLKLWPVSTSDVLVDAFHFGRLDSEEGDREVRFPVGVADPSLEGTDRVDIRAATGFRVIEEWEGVGREDILLLLGCGSELPPLVERDLEIRMLVWELAGWLDIITDDGGELSGVSWAL